MRYRSARWLVRWVARHIDAAYLAYCHGSKRRERYWGWQGRQVQRVAFPLARRLHHEGMVDEMVEHGWWG